MRRTYRFLTSALEWPAAPFVKALAGATAAGPRAGRLPNVSGGVWIHAASAGEVRGIVPLARSLCGAPVLVTAQTETGLRAAGSLLPGTETARAPFDFPRAARRAIESADPATMIVAETEIWPNLFDAAARRGVPLALVNARISDRTIGRYRMLGGLVKPLMARLGAVAAQTDSDAERFAALGVPADRIRVTGNMKHDLEGEEASDLECSWAESGALIVLGSVREGEEDALAEALSLVHQHIRDLRIVAAPRHHNRRSPVGRALHARGFRVSFRSEGGPAEGDQVLVLDSMGELNGFYRRASVAFVGGTFAPFGGHNIVEPAHFGVPVVHGPFTSNCRLEAETLDRCGASAVVSTIDDLAEAFLYFLKDDTARRTAAAGAAEALRTLSGSTLRTLDFLKSRGVLPASPGLPR